MGSAMTGLTPGCPVCGHPHYLDVAFTCTRFTCECTAISAVPEQVVDRGMVSEKTPWRGLNRGDRAVLEARSGTRYVPLALRPLEGMQVIIAGYASFKPDICQSRNGAPHYHVVLVAEMTEDKRIDTMPFVCVPAGMVRPLKPNEAATPMVVVPQHEPELVIRGRRAE